MFGGLYDLASRYLGVLERGSTDGDGGVAEGGEGSLLDRVRRLVMRTICALLFVAELPDRTARSGGVGDGGDCANTLRCADAPAEGRADESAAGCEDDDGDSHPSDAVDDARPAPRRDANDAAASAAHCTLRCRARAATAQPASEPEDGADGNGQGARADGDGSAQRCAAHAAAPHRLRTPRRRSSGCDQWPRP